MKKIKEFIKEYSIEILLGLFISLALFLQYRSHTLTDTQKEFLRLQIEQKELEIEILKRVR